MCKLQMYNLEFQMYNLHIYIHIEIDYSKACVQLAGRLNESVLYGLRVAPVQGLSRNSFLFCFVMQYSLFR